VTRNILVNKEQSKVDVIIELSVGMVHALGDLAMSTFWLFDERASVEWVQIQHENAMGIVVVVDREQVK
jgi:hypothetical protein